MATATIKSISFTDVEFNGVTISGNWDASTERIEIEDVHTFDQFSLIFANSSLAKMAEAPGAPVAVASKKAQPASPAPSVTTKKVAPKAATVTTTLPVGVVNEETAPDNSDDVEVKPKQSVATASDDSIFFRLTLLGEVVEEIRRRGANNYDEILEFVLRLRDTEMCPVLDRIEKQGKLDDRLRQHCISKDIPGA